MSFTLGIDGGGTRTRAVVVDGQGTVLGVGISGPSDFDAVGLDIARSNLHQAIKQACESMSGLSEIKSIYLGIAGVVAEKDTQVVSNMLNGIEFSPDAIINISHDCKTALAGAIGDKQGLVLVSGTGSSCFGRNSKGQELLSGGWGFLLADVGSGYYLGHQALVAIVNAFDGRGKLTALTDPVLTALQIDDINDVMNRIYHPKLDTSGIASLAPIVTNLAVKDDVAMSIIENGCKGLVEVVGSVVSRLKFENDYYIVAVGGLATSKSIFSEKLNTSLAKAFPSATIVPPIASPLTGAVILGMEILGLHVNDNMTSKIESGINKYLS